MDPTEPETADKEFFMKTRLPTSMALTLFSSLSNGLEMRLLKALAKLPKVSERFPNIPIDDTIFNN